MISFLIFLGTLFLFFIVLPIVIFLSAVRGDAILFDALLYSVAARHIVRGVAVLGNVVWAFMRW